MFRKPLLFASFLLLGLCVDAQSPTDSTATGNTLLGDLDSTLFMDDATFDALISFIDSLASPHDYLMFNLAVGTGIYNFRTGAENGLTTTRQLISAPSAGYFHRSGFGIMGSAYIIKDAQRWMAYQGSVTASYDFLKRKDVATGLAFTRYFTRDSLSFYTSPLQNELYAYLSYRKWWIRPLIAASYAWGSRSDFMEREDYITSLRLRPYGYTHISSTESVKDFSVLASVRHDFYWLQVASKKDHIRVTPQINFTSGTQKFGFNQTANSYASNARSGRNVLYSSDAVNLDDALYFQPLSLSFFLRAEYGIGRLYIQPAYILDYYFPATEQNLNSLFTINLGLLF